MKKVLVLFSGGKDSLLSAIKLIEQGYKVVLVHYDNMMSLGNESVQIGYKRLKEKYSENMVEYLGIKNISAFFRIFIKEIYSSHIKDIENKYGNLTISEFNCFACRLSMYVASIIICLKYNIKYVADGARTDQLFAIEQNEMLDIFKKLFKKYNIELLLPLKDFNDNFQEKNELLIRGFIPKVNESACLLGLPLNKKDKVTIQSLINIYNDTFFKIVEELIKNYQSLDFTGDFL